MQAGSGRARRYLWRVALGIGRKRAELGPAMGLDSSDGQQHLRWCKQDVALRFEQGGDCLSSSAHVRPHQGPLLVLGLHHRKNANKHDQVQQTVSYWAGVLVLEERLWEDG